MQSSVTYRKYDVSRSDQGVAGNDDPMDKQLMEIPRERSGPRSQLAPITASSFREQWLFSSAEVIIGKQQLGSRRRGFMYERSPDSDHLRETWTAGS